MLNLIQSIIIVLGVLGLLISSSRPLPIKAEFHFELTFPYTLAPLTPNLTSWWAEARLYPLFPTFDMVLATNSSSVPFCAKA